MNSAVFRFKIWHVLLSQKGEDEPWASAAKLTHSGDVCRRFESWTLSGQRGKGRRRQVQGLRQHENGSLPCGLPPSTYVVCVA